MSEKKATSATMVVKLHRPKHEVPSFDTLYGDDVSGLACLSNDDVESAEGRLRYQKALERSEWTTAELLEHPFSAQWFFVFRVESRNDENEITGAHYRVVFMDAKGHTYETHSDTAVRTLRNWIAVKGWSLWKVPVTFSVEQKKGASGRTYHVLRMVNEANDQPESK